jgi:copper chaperone
MTETRIAETTIMNVTLKSSAIRCGGCANNVQSVLSKFEGIRSVQADPATKLIDVEFDEQRTSGSSIASRLADAGFPVDEPPKRRGMCR